MKYTGTRYPGQGHMWVICAVCRGKFHKKDTVLVRDKYNWQNGMVVCKADLDKVNPQSYPVHPRPRPVLNPQKLTGEASITYSTPDTDDRLPDAPLNLRGVGSPLDENAINLTWDGPLDAGSSGIIGYVVKRANPQLGTYDTLSSNTGTAVPYYSDTSATLSTEYSYIVAAINTFGTGAYSEPFFWPTPLYSFYGVIYIVDENGVIITDENGNYLTDNSSV